MIKLGEAAKYLRGRLGLSQRAAAEELGISYVHLCNIENERVSPSPEMIDRFRATWGIDLYMLAVGLFADIDDIPQPIRKPMKELTRAWTLEVDRLINARLKEESNTCSEFNR